MASNKTYISVQSFVAVLFLIIAGLIPFAGYASSPHSIAAVSISYADNAFASLGISTVLIVSITLVKYCKKFCGRRLLRAPKTM